MTILFWVLGGVVIWLIGIGLLIAIFNIPPEKGDSFEAACCYFWPLTVIVIGPVVVGYWLGEKLRKFVERRRQTALRQHDEWDQQA